MTYPENPSPNGFIDPEDPVLDPENEDHDGVNRVSEDIDHDGVNRVSENIDHDGVNRVSVDTDSLPVGGFSSTIESGSTLNDRTFFFLKCLFSLI